MQPFLQQCLLTITLLWKRYIILFLSVVENTEKVMPYQSTMLLWASKNLIQHLTLLSIEQFMRGK